MKIGTRCAEADWICDYIPGLSSFSNLADFAQKGIGKVLPEDKKKNRYWTHIRNKDSARCLVLTVLPVVGNVYYFAKDYFDYKKAKVDCVAVIREDRQLKQTQAARLAMAASRSSGRPISLAQMTPARLEDEQALWLGCYTDSLSLVRRLLDKDISPNFYHIGQIPLVTACCFASKEMVRLLLDYKADAKVFDRYGNSPLMVACSKGDFEIVQLLHSVLEDIDVANFRGVTPLMCAAASGHQKLVTFLLEQGADRHKKANDGSDALSNALSRDQVDLLPMLIGERGDVDAFKYRIEIPGPFNISFCATHVEQLTPLLYATALDAVTSAHYLLPRSDVRSLDSTGCTVLHYSTGNTELLRAYLETCSIPEFVNAQHSRGSTALHRAIELGHLESAMLLLRSHADPLIVNNKGKTPLILACEKGYTDVVSFIDEYHQVPVEMKAQVAFAICTGVACPAQASPREKSVPLNRLDLMSSSFDSFFKYKIEKIEETVKLGPEPRSGMEMIFKKIPWPDEAQWL